MAFFRKNGRLNLSSIQPNYAGAPNDPINFLETHVRGGGRRLHHRTTRQRSGSTAGRNRRDRQSSGRQQRRQSLSRHPRLGTAHAGEKAVGRLQRRGHRPGRQDPCGRPTVARRESPRAVSAPRQTRSIISTSRQGDQELWRRNVRVAARHPCRSRRQRVGDRRARGEPDELRSFRAKTRRAASSSSSVPKARC